MTFRTVAAGVLCLSLFSNANAESNCKWNLETTPVRLECASPIVGT